MKPDYSLYLIADERFVEGMSLKAAVEQAILGGVSLVQLREKDSDTRSFYKKAVELRELTRQYGIPLIINDRVDIALAADADGVHLGQKDLPVGEARKILGPGKIIGATVRSIEQAAAAKAEGADYLGVGAVYPTSSKDDVAKIIGVDGLKAIADSIAIPKVAIGGINGDNCRAVLDTGVNGIAVISCILKSSDIRGAAARLRGMISQRI